MLRGTRLLKAMSVVTETFRQTYVGSLACQRNSFICEDFETVVVACNEGKKNTYEVELQDTILFPEGGGQPCDTGKLRTESGDTVSVMSVARKGLNAIHVTDKEVPVGGKVTLSVDWDKRFDYMQQHTGQHLVSAVLEQRWDLKTLSWSMGGIPTEKKPRIEPYDLFNYLEVGRKLTPDQIEELSDIVNTYITANPKRITVLEGDPENHEDISTHKVPDDYDLSKGVLRVIEISDLDKNPCCGTHLNSTSQISSVLILPNQSSVRGANSRIYFMCGDRVRKYAAFTNNIMSQSKKVLSCTDDQITTKCETLMKNMQKVLKREQFWIKELAPFHAKLLIKDLEDGSKGSLVQDEFGTLEFLLQVYNAVNHYTVDKSLKDYCYVLAGRDKSSVSGSVIVVSDSGERITEVTNKLKSLIPLLKGGGGKNGGKWQGKVTAYNKNEFELLKAYLEDGL